MIYLFLQTWAWIIAAFFLGMCAGWWLSGRCNCHSKSKDEQSDDHQADSDEIEVEESWRPQGLPAKPESVDDLKKISGVGPVIEKTLHELGIYHFQQIADFNRDNIAWVDNYISFQGRIDREGWVEQAKKLAAGEETEFSRRVEQGGVDY